MEKIYKHYWYGTGILFEKTFQFAENIILRPIRLNLEMQEFERRSQTRSEFGFLCALADQITFEMEITASTAKSAALEAWNKQYVLIFLSIYKGSPITWPLRLWT